MTRRTSLSPHFEPYQVPAGFGVITCYFNPEGYESKLRNYCLFRESLRVSGVPCLTIACLFPGQRPTLFGNDVYTVTARDTMWQKERLLNLAISRLPEEWTTVAWIDCDVLFENPDWAMHAVEQLNSHAVVQLFSEAIRLPQGQNWGRQGGECWEGFAAVAKVHPNQLLQADFTRHGHTGFAWAAHRDLLTRHGLYDGCITGSGDHLMAHAFAGDWTGDCIDRMLGTNQALRKHFTQWAQPVYKTVRARISYVPGALFHLWHGHYADRQYSLRDRELCRGAFDPACDLKIGESGCWEWAGQDAALHAWATRYFSSRKEDGDPAVQTTSNPAAIQPFALLAEAR